MNTRRKPLKLLIAVGLPALLMLACAVDFSAFSSPVPTPTKPVLAVDVTVMYVSAPEQPAAQAQPTGTASPTAILMLTDGGMPLPTPIPTDTPAFQPTATPSPTSTPTDDPPAPLTSTTTVTGANVVTQTGDPAAQPDAAATGPDVDSPVQGTITLIAPENNAALPSNANELEVKWQWQGDSLELARCGELEGYGFEVRIRPAQDGYGFLGAMDASKNQEDSFLACDPETGIYTYMIKYLKDKPGVKATKAGKFLWDVALVQLEPYQPVITAPPRIFEITFDYYGSLDPFGAPLSCGDFNSWAEAQAVFLKAGGPGQDPHGLDPDSNGTACDDLKAQ